MAMDVEAEIRDLKRRVGEREGSFGFLTRQVKGVHKDLLTFQANGATAPGLGHRNEPIPSTNGAEVRQG
jgi:hypothetical protein